MGEFFEKIKLEWERLFLIPGKFATEESVLSGDCLGPDIT